MTPGRESNRLRYISSLSTPNVSGVARVAQL